jgi:hypothetical protein
MQRLLNRLIPFFLIGIALLAFAFGIFLLAYLFLFGAAVGLVLFFINLIKEKFFQPTLSNKPKKTKQGRTIDSDDWKVL